MSDNTNSNKDEKNEPIENELSENVLSINDAPLPTFNALPDEEENNNDIIIDLHKNKSVKKLNHIEDDNNSEILSIDSIPEPVDDIQSLKSINTRDENSSQRSQLSNNQNWFSTREYIVFKNQLHSLKKCNNFILKEGKECKRLLDLKYEDLTSMVNNIQTSVIFMSTLSGFFQATKTQFAINVDIIAVVSITISTYISLILSISKYYKLDELKDRIQTLREKYSLLHNRIDYRMDVLGPWNNKHLWEHQDPKIKMKEWTEVVMNMQTDYNEIIKTKQQLTTEFEVIMDTISRNKYNTLNSLLNYSNREQLFMIRQKESQLERRIMEANGKYGMSSRPSIVLQHEELDNWDEDDSIV